MYVANTVILKLRLFGEGITSDYGLLLQLVIL